MSTSETDTGDTVGEPEPAAPTARGCRLEGKLKAYDSVTDARAWSHKVSEQSGLLLERVKRESQCPRKLVPTRVIVELLVAAKGKEIAQLRRRVVELERLLRATDRGDVSALSGGDTRAADAACELASLDSVADSAYSLCYCVSSSDQATSTLALDDPRLLQEEIIKRDAKMAAMQNTIDILEGDICEPYCVYAYINTTLEKIFAILKNNISYRSYLESLQSKQGTNVDLKGRIVIKLKILESFCEGLTTTRSYKAEISFFSQGFLESNLDNNMNGRTKDGVHYNDDERHREEVDSVRERRRSELVADIIASDEMLTLCSSAPADDITTSIGARTTQLARMHQMQTCYAELATRYERLEREKYDLQSAVNACSCGDFEIEMDDLREKAKDNSLLSEENERLLRKVRSLEERNSMLYDELAFCEARLLAEREINCINVTKLENATDDRVNLEALLEDIKNDHRKETNALQQKLAEVESEIIMQEQHIKKAMAQTECTIEKDVVWKTHYEAKIKQVEHNEMESMKNELQKLKVSVFSKNEENLILKEDVEYWRKSCEEITGHNISLEGRINQIVIKLEETVKQCDTMKTQLDEKEESVNDLSNKLCNNSQNLNKLMIELEKHIDEKNVLAKEVIDIKHQLSNFENEKSKIISLFELSDENYVTFKNVDSYEKLREAIINLRKIYCSVCTENKELKSELANVIAEKDQLHKDVQDSAIFTATINQDTLRMKNIEKERINLLDTLNRMQKENDELTNKILHFQVIETQFTNLKMELEHLKAENVIYKRKVFENCNEIDSLKNDIIIKTEKIKELTYYAENIKNNYEKVLNVEVEERKNISRALNIAEKNSSELVKEIDIFKNTNTQLSISEQKQSELIKEKETYIKHLEALCEEKQGQINNHHLLQKELAVAKITQDRLNEENNNLLLEINNLRCWNETDRESLKREIFLHTSTYEKLKQENIRLKEQIKDIAQKSFIPIEDLNLIKKQTENMKSENLECKKKTLDLMYKINDYEKMILTLSEDLLWRDNKIRLLESHVTALEGEVRALQQHLEGTLESAEQLSFLHAKNTDNSTTAIEARYQKAIQILESEIMALTTDKLNLEKDKQHYRSKVSELENNIKSIFAEVEQLTFITKTEIRVEGEHRSVDRICASLKGVAVLLEAQQSKNICLEQTLQKLQMSSQLLRSKADETINVIEKEKGLLESEIIPEAHTARNKSTEVDATLIEEFITNSAVVDAVELNEKLVNAEKLNKCFIQRNETLKKELLHLNQLYQISSHRIIELRESNGILGVFLENFTVEIEKVISSVKSQFHGITLLKLLIKKIKLSQNSLRVQRYSKTIQTDLFTESHIAKNKTSNIVSKDIPIQTVIDIDNKNIELNSSVKKVEKNISYEHNGNIYVRKYYMDNKEKMLIEQYINKNKSLNDVTEISFTVTSNDSLHSLTDDHKLSMSKLNDVKNCSTTLDTNLLESKQTNISQVTFLTSKAIENTLYEITFPKKSKITSGAVKVNYLLNESVEESDISERLDKSIRNINIKRVDDYGSSCSEVHIIDRKDSTFFHIYDSDGERQNASRQLQNVDIQIYEEPPKYSDEFYKEYTSSRCKEIDQMKRWSNKFSQNWYEDMPTHDRHQEEELQPHSNVVENIIQSIMFCPNLPQIDYDTLSSSLNKLSALQENVPYLLPASMELQANVKVVCQTDSEESTEDRISPERSYMSERDVSRRMGAVRMQYERQMRRVAVEHEEGVSSLQRLHEQTVRDLKRAHELQVADLRIRADRLAREHATLLATIPLIQSPHSPHLRHHQPVDEPNECLQTDEVSKKTSRDLKLSKTAVQTLELRPKLQRRRVTSSSATTHRARARDSTCQCQMSEIRHSRRPAV